MRIESPDFHRKQKIPSRFTCDGEDMHPTLLFLDVPAGIKSFAIIVDDLDSVGKKNWVHWLIWNIPSTVSRLEEGSLPGEAIEGMTDFGTVGYGGPCPNHGEHRYVFRLYALNAVLALPSGASRADLEKAMDAHLIAQAELPGVYQKIVG